MVENSFRITIEATESEEESFLVNGFDYSSLFNRLAGEEKGEVPPEPVIQSVDPFGKVTVEWTHELYNLTALAEVIEEGAIEFYLETDYQIY